MSTATVAGVNERLGAPRRRRTEGGDTVSTTQATAAVMEQVASRFDRANQELQAMLATLMRELDVLQSQWQGRGGRSFDQVKQAWAVDQQKIHRALAETASAIRTAGSVYTITDEEAQRRFRPGSVSLPL
jgi:WXG100 family type VII secretion target